MLLCKANDRWPRRGYRHVGLLLKVPWFSCFVSELGRTGILEEKLFSWKVITSFRVTVWHWVINDLVSFTNIVFAFAIDLQCEETLTVNYTQPRLLRTGFSRTISILRNVPGIFARIIFFQGSSLFPDEFYACLVHGLLIRLVQLYELDVSKWCMN